MDQLNEIVERVLDFARQSEPKTGEVDINQLAQNLYVLTRHKMKQHRIDFQMQLSPSLPSITADAGQLEQVLLNLTLNAIEAMPEGGDLQLSTSVTSCDQGDQVCIRFKDSGHGLDEKQVLTSTGLLQSKKPQGTGLGLMVVKKIVESHCGIIRIESKKKQGTSIQIRIPVKASDPGKQQGA